ncbi:hypothetical protein CR513_30449, partial [Mucuna pruriens]
MHRVQRIAIGVDGLWVSPNLRHQSIGNPINQVDEEEIDWEPPEELKKLVELEGRTIQPHKEGIETINFGCEERIKEIKIDTTMRNDTKKEPINLVTEYVDIFAWTY